MRIFTISTLSEFWCAHPDSEIPLRTWITVTKAAAWANATEVLATFNTASPIPNDRVVFNIGGNNFRLVAAMKYERGTVFVKFLGTHAAYDKIDAPTVSFY